MASDFLEFETQFAYGIKMRVYAEALLGQDDNIYIRAYNHTDVDELNAIEVDLDTSAEHWYTVDLQGLASGDVVEVPLPLHDATSLLAYAAQTVYRVDQILGAHVTGAQTIHIIPRWADNARLDTSWGGIQVGHNVRTKKYVVAHELGHWFQWKWGALGVFAYEYGPDDSFMPPQPLDSPCQFPPLAVAGGDSSSHGLRSAEWSSGALTEGFAHFIAAVTFNDIGDEDGIFTYYKAIDTNIVPDYQDLVDVDYAVSLQGGVEAQGGTERWVDNMCPTDWDWPYTGDPEDEEITSEIDWMRFFWDLVASQQQGLGDPATVPDVLDILDAADWSYAPGVWADLVDAVTNHPDPNVSAHSARFQALNDDNGVFNDEQ